MFKTSLRKILIGYGDCWKMKKLGSTYRGTFTLWGRGRVPILLLHRSSNKMPTGVKAALANAAEKEGGLSSEGAKKYIDNMVREGRLIEECWS